MDSRSTAVLPPAGGAAPVQPRLEKFGRYFLLERIATGGMAEVYRAVTNGVEGFRRTFVIKRILAEKAASPTFVKMFIDEARICALLHHPNVVQVYDFGNVNGSYFLAMEYLQGKDLSSLLRVLRAAKASVPAGLAAFIAREAANGLHYAHSLRGAGGQPLGIVHRDVTPSNVMLLFPGGVKVLDFGIAKAATEAARSEGEGVKGKFGYLAPEQARNSAAVDGRADVFALGVTLWEMLVGRRLFAGKDDVETLQNVLQKPVPAPSSIRPEIPAELDRIVLRALERPLERRYVTAEEMARDCDRIVREARVDGQTLRAFLNDLFAEESSSLSLLGAPEIPDELFEAALSGPINASSTGVPKADPSLQIEVVDPSAPNPRLRTPAPPFGVIAADGVPARRFGKVALLALGVVAAAVAVVVGLSKPPGPVASAATVAEAPSRTQPASVPPVTPAPAAAPAPAPVAEAPAAPAAAAPAASGEKAAEKAHRHRRRDEKLGSDLTLNPF